MLLLESRHAWCAVNPLNKYLYTSFYDADHLLVYKRDILGDTTRGIVGLELIYKGKFALFHKDGTTKFSLKGIQG
jgi:hypothetical protein